LKEAKAESWLTVTTDLLLGLRAMNLERHFVEKPWGRDDIPPAFDAPAGQRIGEVWYESPDGAPLPLLVKWLFTSEKLSIQVHPSDDQARARGLASGKEECWYIVDAEPGAVLGMGTTRPLDTAELRAASLSGEIEGLMDWKPVQAGDYFYIPAGTVHAIGAGITLVEVQQYADITYRLYDYGRLDKGVMRELHLEDGVAVSKAEGYADPRSGKAKGTTQLVDGPYFKLWLVDNADALAALPADKQRWIVPLEGHQAGQCQLADAGVIVPFKAPVLVASV
jgi:mannose-6-phosphate isomerase